MSPTTVTAAITKFDVNKMGNMTDFDKVLPWMDPKLERCRGKKPSGD
jgi:hypothetical protein